MTHAGADPEGEPSRRDVRFTREMSLTREDFLRTLPNAVTGELSVDGDTARIDDERGTAEIRFTKPHERRIGALTLPVCTLEFRFTGYSQPDLDAFMERFETRFRRGGG